MIVFLDCDEINFSIEVRNLGVMFYECLTFASLMAHVQSFCWGRLNCLYTLYTGGKKQPTRLLNTKPRRLL